MRFVEYLKENKMIYDVFGSRLDVSGKGLTDLDGIESFRNLEYLDCSNNLLTSLDISKNKHLTALFYHGNQIESVVDISNNPYLLPTPIESLELRQVWNELKVFVQNKVLVDGLRIEYYGEKMQYIDRPLEGVIRKDDIGFCIVFDDSVVRLDGSEHSNIVLKRCGYMDLG